MTNPLNITDEEKQLRVSEFMLQRKEEGEILELFRSLSPDEQEKMLEALAAMLAGKEDALDDFAAYLRQSRGLPDDWPSLAND